MYINKAQQYAISRFIFNIEEALRSNDTDRRWRAYDALKELGIDTNFHKMPEHVQEAGDNLYWKTRAKTQWNVI